jgi:AAA domain
MPKIKTAAEPRPLTEVLADDAIETNMGTYDTAAEIAADAEPAAKPAKAKKGPARPAPAQPKQEKNAALNDDGDDVEITPQLTSIGVSLNESVDFANVMYTGEGGTGKTTDLADMARLGRVIVINAESGLKGGPLRRMGIPIENITVWPNVEAGERLTWESLDKLIWKVKAQLEKEPGSIAGIMLDSATEVHIALLDQVRERSVAKSLEKDKDRDPFKTELQDYGIMTEQMRNLLRRLRDLPCHFGVSTLHKRDKDDDGKVVYRSDMTEKLANSLYGYMDIVVVTTVNEIQDVTEYIGLTKPKGKYRGKDRFGVLPEKMLEPTFSRILGYINGTIVRETDQLQLDAIARRVAAPPQEDDGDEGAPDAE